MSKCVRNYAGNIKTDPVFPGFTVQCASLQNKQTPPPHPHFTVNLQFHTQQYHLTYSGELKLCNHMNTEQSDGISGEEIKGQWKVKGGKIEFYDLLEK